MGLILIPDEVKTQTDALTEALNNINEGFKNVLSEVNSFADNDKLQGDSWKKLKEKASEYHGYIEMGMEGVQDSIAVDASLLAQSVGSEPLEEDMLLDVIERMQAETVRVQNMIDMLEAQRTSSAFSPAWNARINQRIAVLEQQLENAEYILKIYQEKLEFLYSVEDSTKGLFNTGIQLISAMAAVISEVGVKIMTGNPDATLQGIDCESYKKFIVEKGEESVKDKWITEVMQIDGNTEQEKKLNIYLESINAGDNTLKWDQEKVNKVWEACNEYYDKTGIQVDPRLLMAIIVIEGTGSFNTSNTNLAADGQNGININFEEDVALAVDLLGGKIVAYPYYQAEFSTAREDAYKEKLPGIKDYDDILHYLNWETPRVSLVSNSFFSSVYAMDNSWNSKVREIYSEIAYDQVSKDYTEYALSLEQSKLIQIAEEYDIAIEEVSFFAKKNGQTMGGIENDEYTIVGGIK